MRQPFVAVDTVRFTVEGSGELPLGEGLPALDP